MPTGVPNVPKHGDGMKPITWVDRGLAPAGPFRGGQFGTLGTLRTCHSDVTVVGVVLAHEAVEGRLVILRLASAAFGEPGVELRLDGVDIPAREITPDPRQRLVRERGAEERHGTRLGRLRRSGDGRHRLRACRPPLPRPVGCAAAHAQGWLLAGQLQGKVEAGQVIFPDDGEHLELEAAIFAFRA